jgi:hypothetical protein
VRAIYTKSFDYPVRTYFKLVLFLLKGDNQFIRGGMHGMNEMHKQHDVCTFLTFSQTHEIMISIDEFGGIQAISHIRN